MSYALVVIDYQVDFVSGSLGSDAAVAIEPKIIRKIEDCLQRGGKLFFTMDTHDPGYLDTDEGRRIPIIHCEKDSPGWQLYGKVADYAKYGTMITKSTFGSLGIPGLLAGFNEIELCGVATNVCVITNAVLIKTAHPESKVYVEPEAVASYDKELHLKALDVMASFGIDVIGR
ncbi:MAG: cysteine hydrolase [Candidatus Methanoplasma sp.]|nr:cysteine hydrolase [Candidatus Methanoplasma sp.]